ncbi:MAG: hypothetical protein PHS94_07905 [Erysipelotrichaceae bacterium]|nr:hypothetical protein [Erysipelotrichaceae bacterium]
MAQSAVAVKISGNLGNDCAGLGMGFEITEIDNCQAHGKRVGVGITTNRIDEISLRAYT